MATSLMDQATSFADANKVEPFTNEFDETKGTAGRVDSIIKADSPLMQRAATLGTQTAAARGLTNSSLAAQASQMAVLDAATPIATSDANLFQQQTLNNQNAKNTASLADASNKNVLGNTALQLTNSNEQQDKTLAQQAQQFGVQAGQAQQQIDAQISQFAQSLGMTVEDLKIKRDSLNQNDRQFLADLETRRGIAQLQAETSLTTAGMTQDTQRAIASLDANTKTVLAQLQAENNSSINSNQNIASAWANFMTNVASIQNNPNLEQGAKQTLIQNNIEAFQAFSEFWKGATGIDVSALLDFGIGTAPTIPGTNGDGTPKPGDPGYVAPGQPGYVVPGTRPGTPAPVYEETGGGGGGD